MAVTRIGQSTIKQGLKKNETFTAGIPPILGKFYHMGTVEVGAGGASSIEFTNIPAIYKHLQVRYIVRTAWSGQVEDTINVRFNSDSGSNYAWHALVGTGSAVSAGAGVSQTRARSTRGSAASETASVFGAGVLQILDYADTSKNTTVFTFGGVDGNGNGQAVNNSGLWMNTSAVTTLTLISDSGNNFVEFSTAALYGVK